MTEESDELLKVLKELEEHDQVRTDDDGARTVTLADPVQHRGRTFEEVVFSRAPRGHDWLETDKAEGNFGKGLRLAASLSGVPFQVFLNMSGDDAMLCVSVAGVMGKK